MIKRKTGLSQGAAIGPEEFQAFRDAGIDCLEISPSEKQYDSIDIGRLKALSDAYGVELRSFHLRFCDFARYDISGKDEDARRFAVAYHKKFISDCAAAGIKIFVVHASGEPIENADRAARIDRAKASLCELAEYADRFGAVVAVENLPRTCLGNTGKELMDLISCDDRLRIYFDTNHLLSEDHETFLRAVAPKLITTHFSNYDFINERHWLPGEGDIDWKALMDLLDETGYAGAVVYEVPLAAAMNTLARHRDLTPADIKRNHIELESRASLTVIGRRYDNLGF